MFTHDSGDVRPLFFTPMFTCDSGDAVTHVETRRQMRVVIPCIPKKKTYKINTTAFRFHFLQYTKVLFNLATAGKFSQYNGLGHAIWEILAREMSVFKIQRSAEYSKALHAIFTPPQQRYCFAL